MKSTRIIINIIIIIISMFFIYYLYLQVVMSFLVVFLALFDPSFSNFPSIMLISIISSVPFLWLTGKISTRFGEHSSSAAFNRMPYVLYLRPFNVDNSFDSIIGKCHSFLSWLTFPISILISDPDTALECNLVRALERFGTVIAIGRPEDIVAPSGANRQYVRGDRWKQEVEDLLRFAHIVVMIAGRGKGVIWEMNQIRTLVDPLRLLLVLPESSQLEMKKTLLLAIDCFKPVNTLNNTDLSVFEGPEFFRFDESWRIIKLRRIQARRSRKILGMLLHSRRIQLNQTLLPFFCNTPEYSPRNVRVDGWRMRKFFS